MKDSNLSRWLYQQGCFLTKDSNLEITHICLDGGRLNIPNHLIGDFFSIYSKGLLVGEKYYICELPTPVVKFFCDFDYVNDNSVSDGELENWSKICRKSVIDIFGCHYDFWILRSKVKAVQKNKRKQLKSGFHFVWKELYLSQENAEKLSMYMASKFNEEFPDTKWSEVIDTQVYRGGMRMMGSRKVVNKKKRIREVSSQSETQQTQANDYEVIKIDEGREYIPYMEVILGGIEKPEEDELCYYNIKQLKNLFNECSIRTYNNEKEIKTKQELPELPEKRKKKSSNRRDTDVEDPKVFDRVEAFIRYQTITQWNSPLLQLRKHNKFYIAKIDSMYCLNIQREHNSCGIYFQITETGLYQRCFCRCDTEEGRLNGLCSEYKSSPFQLPREVLIMLFPKSSTKKQIKTEKNSPNKEIFASNLLMKKKETLNKYLQMSMNTIKEIEGKCR